MNFVSDALANSRPFRCLTVVDDCTCKCPAIEVAHSPPTWRVIAVVTVSPPNAAYCAALGATGLNLLARRSINGRAWRHAAVLHLGIPIKSAYRESCNGKLHTECLSAHWFPTIPDA